MKKNLLILDVLKYINLLKKWEFMFVSTLCMLFLLSSTLPLHAQGKTYQIRTIAFYNVENLFDTENDSLIHDDDRTPGGRYHWTHERYQTKLKHLEKVLPKIGSGITYSAPDLIGICEVENKSILGDLINQPELKKWNYGIIHFDSPDERGIDVALLYKKSIFLPIDFQSRRLLLYNENNVRDFTRDQLVISGLLDGERIYLIVNHWPSRSGGEQRSKPYRLAAARLNQRIMDSIQRLDADAKIISMGDFNDDPVSSSLKKILNTRGKKKDLDSMGIFNPMEKLYRKGLGSLAYRDKWSLFDQIFFTANLLDSHGGTYRFWKAGIFNPPFLITQYGKYKGYPLRTYSGNNYIGGYSNHFPVFIHLVREADSPPKVP